MGVNSRLRDIRPPLPAPTESIDEGGTSGPDTDVATNVTTRTDKSSYEIPDDGSPITIPTDKLFSKKEGALGGHQRDKSQASLLIEYFESSRNDGKGNSKPSVRVKVSQGSKTRSSSGAKDAVLLTGFGDNRKPSYARRISLGSSKNAEIGLAPTDFDSLAGNLSGKRPLQNNPNDSDISNRNLIYAPVESNVSSMPADSMLEGSEIRESERSRSLDREEESPLKDYSYLQAPAKDRSRSTSKERIAQKVMEKLNQTSSVPLQSGKSRSQRSLSGDYDSEGYPIKPRRKSSRSLQYDAPDQKSYLAGSDVSNNPKLLGMVEDTIKRIILPEIQQAKEDQKTGRSPRSEDNSRRASLLDVGLARRVSKSSSSPNISSKPKVVLNRQGEEPGTVLSRGDSERKRISSRGSSTEDRPKSRKSNHSLRDAGAASLGAGILTAAALQHHDSQNDVQERRKKRSKSRGSRSRSAGVTPTGADEYAETRDIPALPMAGNHNDSELTRESIVSSGTERPHSYTPVHEVSRGSIGDARASPNSSRTPTRTPVSRSLGMSHGNVSIGSPKSSSGGLSTKERMAALAAAGVGGAALATGATEAYSRHGDADGYGDSPSSQRKISSPVQSVSSLKKNFEDDSLVPKELRPRSAASWSSAGRTRDKRASKTSLHSTGSSPRTKLSRSQMMNEDEYNGSPAVANLPGGDGTLATPAYGERMGEYRDYQGSSGDGSANRDSFAPTNRDSYQTNPYPQDENRWSMFTDNSRAGPDTSPIGEQNIRSIGANAQFVQSPHRAESAVASLMDPSTLSSGSPTKASYSDRMSAHLRELGKDSPPMYQGSTLSQTMPSQDRWSALKSHARQVSGSESRDDLGDMESPRQSPARSPVRPISEQPALGASGLPVAEDPLPEIGHFDDTKSDVTTNPSIIHGPLGGDATGKDTWPYTPEPASPVATRDVGSRDARPITRGKESGMLPAVAAAAAAGGAAMGTEYAKRRATVEDEPDERELTPDVGRNGITASRGVLSDGRSAGSLTPEANQRQYSDRDIQDFHRAMEAQDLGDDDVFAENANHARHISGNSHGMASPLYDGATGKGMDHIESKDIVALMHHLTVRDAERNARDTEILTHLVHSAAEMRQSFDHMKRFIVEQDRMIMSNTDRTADSTAQKVLGGPRPLPTKSSSSAMRQSEEDIQTKRKGVLKRALRGLTGGKSANDLAKFEGMLMQILENVEDLKQQGPVQREPLGSTTNASLDTYERLRNVPDSGYETGDRPATASTPSQSGYLPVTPRVEKQQFHSGYDGRRGSANRVSTVLEGDEDESDPYRYRVVNDGFENSERLLTPTQELYQPRALSPNDTPPHRAPAFNTVQGNDVTPRSADRKHKSTSSSLFGGPKISRWSKTTASSFAPDPATLDSPNLARTQKPRSEASRSGSTLGRYPDEDYELQEDDRLRSTQSLARVQEAAETRSMRSQASKITRTPSPLVPSEVSFRQDGYEDVREASPVQEDFDPEFDDPKYQAVRNSLLLEHPQPRQGATPRHQNTLESQAHQFDDASGTNSDVSQRTVSDFDPAMWGSSGTAGLAKHRLSQFEPMSPVSMNSPPAGYGASRSGKNDGPLVPEKKPAVPPSKVPFEEEEPELDEDWEPQYSNSGFSRGGYYSSPFGSGHLLEPIEEVRYSLETESGHSPEPEIASAQAVNMRTTARKITGPRPMGSRSTSGNQQPVLVETSGTVRRKPVNTY